jgi:hypothetical protein
MEPREQQLAYLEELAGELASHGFATELVNQGAACHLNVANGRTPALNEQVHCERDAEGLWVYRWPWHEPIGAVADPTLVVNRIAMVLRSVDPGAEAR